MLDLVEQGEALAFLEAAGGTEDGLLVDGGGVEVGVQDDLASSGQVIAVHIGTGEIQRGLGAGEVAEGDGASGVEGQAGAEGLLGGGTERERPVEVEGVGEVEVGLDVQGPGVVDVVLVDRDVAGVDVQVAVLGVRGRVRVARSNRSMASATRRSSWAVPTRPATEDTWKSTHARGFGG